MTTPGYGNPNEVSGTSGPGRSGTGASGTDPTSLPGQYPPTASDDAVIFGGPLPSGTGAPGTPGARFSGGTDPTTEPGQLDDGLTGLAHSDIVSTGAPGTPGAVNSDGAGPDSVTFTRPGSFGSGSYASDTVRDSVSGSDDWTSANDSGYASGGPQLPGIKGNEPAAGGGRFQPGAGRVLRGGRDVRG